MTNLRDLDMEMPSPHLLKEGLISARVQDNSQAGTMGTPKVDIDKTTDSQIFPTARRLSQNQVSAEINGMSMLMEGS